MDTCPLTGDSCPHRKLARITELADGAVREFFLCQPCADRYMGEPELLNLGVLNKPKAGRCPTCGHTLRNIADTGRMGCGECYSHFGTVMEKVLQNVQGNNEHAGKRTTDKALDEQIEALKLKMARAVEIENYEIAGVLKEKIKELQNKRTTGES